MKSVYLNKRKVRGVISNITHKEHKVYEAHTEDEVGLEPYVDKAWVINTLEHLQSIHTGDPDIVIDYIKAKLHVLEKK